MRWTICLQDGRSGVCAGQIWHIYQGDRIRAAGPRAAPCRRLDPAPATGRRTATATAHPARRPPRQGCHRHHRLPQPVTTAPMMYGCLKQQQPPASDGCDHIGLTGSCCGGITCRQGTSHARQRLTVCMPGSTGRTARLDYTINAPSRCARSAAINASSIARSASHHRRRSSSSTLQAMLYCRNHRTGSANRCPTAHQPPPRGCCAI